MPTGVSPPEAHADEPIVLASCSTQGLEASALCGVARVFEDRRTRQGRTITLRIVVVPARAPATKREPLVFLAGGPGQAATDLVGDLADGLAQAGAMRDLVFIDQRGTGHESPLRCNLLARDDDLDHLASGALPEARLHACLATMDANPRLYTTPIAMEDLDEILDRLGYRGQVNLVGGSYGTYAAQVFAHLYPARVRTLVLDGVVPANADYPLRFAERSQRAFEQVVDECAHDAACRVAFPDPRSDLALAQARLREQPVILKTTRASVVFDVDAFSMFVRSLLGSPDGRGLVPAVVRAAAAGNYDAFAAPVIDGQFGVLESQSVGMYLTVNCTEVLSGATMNDAERLARGTFLGVARAGPMLRACAIWPRGIDVAALHEPLHSEVPALLLSGTVDNATSLDDARSVAATLPRARSVVVRGGGHTVGGTPCMDDVIARFIEEPLVPVDASCIRPITTTFAKTFPVSQ
jgi:pimeloyl-ACP methyl ester carboxylesterase